LMSVRKGSYDFDAPEWASVSDSAKELIKKMICPVEDRYNADQVLHHEWMKYSDVTSGELKLNMGTLNNYMTAVKLKKIALTYIATQLAGREIEELGREFARMDTNGDGVLSYEEVQNALKTLKIKNSEIEEVLKELDSDHDGEIDYTDFIAATMEKSIYMREERIRDAFNMFDRDGDGKITAEELMEVLDKETPHDKQYYLDLIKEVDLNGDGTIDYNEFMEMMTGRSPTSLQ